LKPQKRLLMLQALDNDDLRILQLLQNDGRLTNKEIADKIGKSVSPVYERIKRLQADGYIKKYAAILDNKMIDRALEAYTNVRLKEHSHAMMLEFERRVGNFSEVMECYHMTGEYDFLLKIAVHNMDAYYDFIINRLSRLANVGTVQSFFVLHESKKNTAYPIALAEEKEKSRKSSMKMA
jgi:Lrp/AsnC family transcriptional regulator, leucine-responsive regulatory protein